MISYVILIAIVVAMSIAVFTWLKIIANVEPVASCEEGTSIMVNDYSCEDSSFTLDLKNNGRFSVKGFILTVGDTEGRVPIDRLIPLIEERLDEDGFFVFETPLVPGKVPEAEKTVVFSNRKMKSDGTTEEFDINSIKNMRIQPFVIDKESLEKIVCEDAVIKQDVDCSVPAAAAPVIDDYIHYWPLDDNLHDSAGAHFTEVPGTIVGYEDGGVKLEKRDSAGSGGDSIRAPNTMDLSDESISISFWININSLEAGTFMNKKSRRKGFAVKGDSNGIGFWTKGGGGGGWLRCGINNFFDGWKHIIVTAENPGVKKIYVDKILCPDTLDVNGELNDESKPLFLGSRNLDGNVDEMKIWNRVLSQGEVESIFDGGRPSQ